MAHHLEDHGEAVGSIPGIIHNQDAPFPTMGNLVTLCRLRRLVQNRHIHNGQLNDELAASTNAIAASFDSASVQLDQSQYQRQANAKTTLRPLQCRGYLREHLEDVVQMLSSDPDAGIPHRHHGLMVLTLGGQPDVAPLLRVLGSVAQQVGEYLSQAARIRIKVDGFRRKSDSQLVGLGLNERCNRFYSTTDHRLQLYPLLAESHLALADAAQIEQISETSTWHYRERGEGRFQRVLTLPVPVDAGKASHHLTCQPPF
jgi:hypothetical protein